MSEVLINGTLALMVPDGFTEMSEAELKQAYQNDNPDRWGCHDKNRHLMLAVLYHENRGLTKLLSMITSTKDIAGSTNVTMAKVMKPYGYETKEFFEAEADGHKGNGFRYTYRNQGELLDCRTIVFRHKQTFYTLYWYSRKGHAEEHEAILNGVLASMRFTGE
ncbi:MAG: hypothetical protein IKS32_07235 [Solobacterium sp.]|nr:hypothetical protein [Solobacterium sp.]